jgi:HD-like signal output (HDOD) protein
MEPSPGFEDVAQRLLRLEPRDLPVLRATRDGIVRWSTRRDDVDAARLADLALRDPLMCLRALQHVAATLGERLANPVQTVTSALVLTGIEPFFRVFSNLSVLQDRLADQPQALHGAMAAIERAHVAARLAAAFAVHRQDDDAELLHQAALLHDFAGLLLWCEAPGAALEIAHRQRLDPQLRSEQAQRAVIGCTLDSVGQQLLERWGMGACLREAARTLDENGPAARTVRLAVRLARHLARSWTNAALPDDFRDLGLLLNIPPEGAAMLVRHAL